MPSEKQLAANRKNAEKSTGPLSQEGKKRSSQNALIHGLRSATLIAVDGESEDELTEFRARVSGELNASGAIEEELADRIAIQLWRLRRIPAIESAMMGDAVYQENRIASCRGEMTSVGVCLGLDITRSSGFYSTLIHYENNLTNLLTKNLRILQEIQRSKAIEIEQTNPFN
ncbi:hypothetical protein LCGC14_1027830 [marine sediment metagenome]|uniref:Uncharacterized protein n=1 Tax=marine sediment metagenome TaxID=412755 RepID=A0A0F9NHB0_9ZZZZ|nr:hypothetical protein [Candidatus Aminicenantes bacterium]